MLRGLRYHESGFSHLHCTSAKFYLCPHPCGQPAVTSPRGLGAWAKADAAKRSSKNNLIANSYTAGCRSSCKCFDENRMICRMVRHCHVKHVHVCHATRWFRHLINCSNTEALHSHAPCIVFLLSLKVYLHTEAIPLRFHGGSPLTYNLVLVLLSWRCRGLRCKDVIRAKVYKPSETRRRFIPDALLQIPTWKRLHICMQVY